ncbi:MAG: glycosyltransferase, partial [Chitinophagales bacterium]|nr:glycosyltransferase [Chitinophagales bacterium]
MQLSIIIVSYNVRHFLSLCLQSVFAAVKNIQAEIIVVDNNSTDDTVKWLRTVSGITLIENKQNVGFSAANNQGIRIAKGRYILLLNPDTVVGEDTFEKCLAFMNEHPEAGALGVRMIDGSGKFLPESKRSLPTPFVSFCKMFGLSALFPYSRIFGRYHLKYLDEHKNHQVEVLSGAFMWLRAEALQKVGLLDESFFMYGEDIDLSYRIMQAGYVNYYFASTTIIHFKGESTKKASFNYVKVFYQAMIIFARKHFSGKGASFIMMLIYLAVVFRGALSALAMIASSSLLPIIDAILMFAALYGIETFWATNVKFSPEYYPAIFSFVVVPAYIFIWIISVLLSGGYEKPYRLGLLFKGLFWGTISIAVIYGLLPEKWRFSRAIILLGAVASAIMMIFTRAAYNLIRHGRFSFEEEKLKNIAIAAIPQECQRIQKILFDAGVRANIFTAYHTQNIQRIVKLFDIDELIISSSLCRFGEIISLMNNMNGQVEFK